MIVIQFSIMNQIKKCAVFSFFYAFILSSFLISTVSAKTETYNETSNKERKWLTQLFLEAERNFDMDPTVNSECLAAYNSYKAHLKTQNGWAIRMLESSEWPSVGLLSGSTAHLGNWDECLLVSLPNIQGKYCLVEGKYDFDKVLGNNSIEEAVEWPSDELSVWEILRMFEKNPVRAERKTIQWAICIPSTCSYQDLETSLKKVIDPIFEEQDLDFRLKVDSSSCHIKGEMKYTREFYCAVMFFSLTILLMCLSTLYEIFKKTEKGAGNEELTELMTSFSLIRNVKQLVHYSEKNDFGFVHALKFVSLIMIIYGHRRLYSLGYPNFNPERTEINFKKSVNYVELTHLTFVDVFFMMTGFLTFYLEFSAMSKHGFRYWCVAVIHRWMRLIPAFGMILIFLIYIFPYISDGPLWNDKVSHEISHCKASWWTNLLAINNIVHTEDQCLVVSWYMSADMQLALIGFGLLYITTKNRILGWITIILTFIIGGIVTFVVASAHKFHAVLPIYISFLQNPNGSENFINFYIASYTRIGPYLIGAMTALITRSLKEKHFIFSMKQKVIGLILVFIVGEGYQHIGFVIEYEFGQKYDAVKHALYAATYRPIFVLPYALMLCIYFTAGFSILGKIIENYLVAAIGRLTYSVFLVNTIVQFLHAASQRSVLAGSILMNRYWWVTADVTLSYFFGIVMYLLLESPIANISKIIKQRFLKKTADRNAIPLTTETNASFEKKITL